MIRKIIKLTFLLLFGLTCFASVSTWHLDQLDKFVHFEVDNFSKMNLPARISTDRIEFKIIPLTLIAKNIEIEPTGSIIDQIQPLKIDLVRVRPSLMHMLIGKLHLAKVEIEGTHIKANIKIKDTQEDQPIHLQKILEKIPITQLHISHTQLDLNITDVAHKYQIYASEIDTLATNDVNNLLINFKFEQLTTLYDGKTLSKNALFESHFFLTERNFVLSDFKFKENNDYLVASGSTQHILSKKIITSGNFNIRSNLGIKKGQDLYEIFKTADSDNPLNDIKGNLKSDIRLHFTGMNNYSIKTSTLLQSFSYQNFKLGDIDINGQFNSDSKTIVGQEIKVSNPGLKGIIKNFSMNLNELSFKNIEVKLEHFQLTSFLQSTLNLKVPAEVKAEGLVNCDGQIKNFRIDCHGTMNASNASVSPGKVPIINSLPSAQADGSITVNDKEVSYEAKIIMGASKGSSQGTINFKKGFAINFESPNLNLSEIKKVSVLELEGISKVSGSTQGDSDAATFDLAIDGKSISLNKYKLGDITSNIKYKSGKIFVDKIQGSLISSRYLGQLNIDLINDTLTGKLQFPFVDLAVVKDSIKENLSIPVDILGTGSAIINLDGPLDPEHLSFKAKARLYNCHIDKQHLDTAEFDLQSTLGQINFNSGYFEEKNSNMSLKGQVLIDKKEYDLHFNSQNIQLDDVVYSKNYAAPTKGVFKVDGQIKNSFQHPSVDFHFSSDNFSIVGQKISPLLGDVKLSETKNTAEILGPNGLKLTYRDLKNTPDIHLEGTTQNMNLAPLITSMLGIDSVDDYSIITSSNFNLKMNREDPSKINGYIFLPLIDVSLQKVSLRNEKEVSLFFTNGKANFAPVNLNGEGGHLQIKSIANSPSPLDIQISGLFSLSFMQIFAPFLETLEGQTSINIRIQKIANKFNFIGSSFIEDGFIKLPNIQHAVEDLKVDILFNQDQIMINSIKGKFAGGQLVGDGKIVLKGSKDIPMQIKIHLDNVDLNIPPQVNTIGNADLVLSGTWLPFLLSGTYDVTDGTITKEFSGSDSKSLSPYQIFLPAALRDDNTSPIKLDLLITPISPLKIKNTLVDGKVEGKIKVSGFPQSPALAGNINFTKNTQLNFRDVIFKVRDSSIGLTGTNPPNPNLYILAEARHLGYDIEMLIQGTSEKPKFKLSSQPSLTEPEIISLLTLGYTSSESTTQANAAVGVNKNSNLSGQSSLEIGTGLFSSNPLGKEFKNRFGFDVQVSSRFDSATSVAVPKISATKQFSEKVSGVYSVQTGKDSRREGKIRYELNRGFAATLSVQSQTQEEATLQRGDVLSDILGIDLEFRKDFK